MLKLLRSKSESTMCKVVKKKKKIQTSFSITPQIPKVTDTVYVWEVPSLDKISLPS